MMNRILTVAACLGCVAATAEAAASEPACPAFRAAVHVEGPHWLLWDPWTAQHSPAVALMDVATGREECFPEAFAGIPEAFPGIRYPVGVAAARDARGGIVVYALQRLGGRISRGLLQDRIAFETFREGEPDRPGREWLARPPFFLHDGDLVFASQGETGWVLRAIREPDEERVLAGPFARAPHVARPLGEGRFVIANGDRVWIWPDDTTRVWVSDWAAATHTGSHPWNAPPPLMPQPSSVSQLAVLDGDSLLLASSRAVFHDHPEHGTATVIRARQGMRLASEGDAHTIATDFIGPLIRVDGRPVLWDVTWQRLLVLEPGLEPGLEGTGRVQTLHARAPHIRLPATRATLERLFYAPRQRQESEYRAVAADLDRYASLPGLEAYLRAFLETSYAFGGRDHRAWKVDVLAYSLLERIGGELPAQRDRNGIPVNGASSTDDVIAAWSLEPMHWQDADVTIGRFATDRREQLAVLAADPDAVARLLDLASPEAVFALAALRAPEADPLFRKLLANPTEARECHRRYPRAALGAVALEHLHGRPLAELFPLTDEEEARLRTEEAEHRAEEVYDWGPSYGGWLLHRLGPAP